MNVPLEALAATDDVRVAGHAAGRVNVAIDRKIAGEMKPTARDYYNGRVGR